MAIQIPGFEQLCGENGLVNQINQTQQELNEIITNGKNAINAIQDKINDVKNIAAAIEEAPDKIQRMLQEEIKNLMSIESLANPTGFAAKILELRAAYQNAGEAVTRVLDNVEAFAKDPLGTPLDLCKDIPNIVQVGEELVELAQPGKMPDPTALPANIIDAVKEEYEEITELISTKTAEVLETTFEQSTPTNPKFPIPDIGNDMIQGGNVPLNFLRIEEAPNGQKTVRIPPGSANAAAVSSASGGVPPEERSTFVPPPSITNPYSSGTQYVKDDFAPSKYASNIASQINTLHPALRDSFAKGIQDYLEHNFDKGRDCNVTEGYRSPQRSAKLAASGIRAAPAGKSWHNYGLAMDVAIYVNGRWDDGRNGVREYTGLLRESMSKFGLINDLAGDSGHFYVSSFGAGVPKDLYSGQVTVDDFVGYTPEEPEEIVQEDPPLVGPKPVIDFGDTPMDEVFEYLNEYGVNGYAFIANGGKVYYLTISDDEQGKLAGSLEKFYEHQKNFGPKYSYYTPEDFV